MTDPWCCHICCAMDPIKINPSHVSITSTSRILGFCQVRWTWWFALRPCGCPPWARPLRCGFFLCFFGVKKWIRWTTHSPKLSQNSMKKHKRLSFQLISHMFISFHLISGLGIPVPLCPINLPRSIWYWLLSGPGYGGLFAERGQDRCWRIYRRDWPGIQNATSTCRDKNINTYIYITLYI